MKYLGVDYGSKRVGIAVSNSEGTIAFPRSAVLNDRELVEHIKRMCEEEKIEKIVVGDTRTVGGMANPVTKEAEAFMRELQAGTSLPVESAFEGWSSIEASRYAEKGNEHNDAAAAAVILQRYLDMKANSVG